ncbi:hypothetical protein LTR94_033040, partial [Friedmanniomyces endolithicus]
GHGAGHIVNQIAVFRVDGKSVAFKSRSLISIKDGDVVAAAGALKNGTLEALAVRNITTGAVYAHNLIMPAVLTGLLGLISLMTVGIFVGYLGLAATAFVGWRIWQAHQASTAVKAA